MGDIRYLLYLTHLPSTGPAFVPEFAKSDIKKLERRRGKREGKEEITEVQGSLSLVHLHSFLPPSPAPLRLSRRLFSSSCPSDPPPTNSVDLPEVIPCPLSLEGTGTTYSVTSSVPVPVFVPDRRRNTRKGFGRRRCTRVAGKQRKGRISISASRLFSLYLPPPLLPSLLSLRVRPSALPSSFSSSSNISLV